MSQEFWRKIAENHGQVLARLGCAGYKVDLVDDHLDVVAVVTDKDGKSTQLPLERLGFMYSDETNKLYSLASGDEAENDELVDAAVTAAMTGHLPYGGDEAEDAECDDCGCKGCAGHAR